MYVCVCVCIYIYIYIYIYDLFILIITHRIILTSDLLIANPF